MTTSCSMCEPIRTAQSFGDDTHTMTTGLHLGMRTRTSQRCVVRLCRWVESLAHRWCSSKDAGNVERETPNPCGKRNRRSPKEQHTSCPQSTHTQNSRSPNALNSPTLTQSNSQRSSAHCSMLLATVSSQLPYSSLSSFTSLPSLLPEYPPQLLRSFISTAFFS